MATVKVQVKFKKDKYDVDVNTLDKPSVFKAQLFALSGVMPDRQKIMMKGMTLKDDDSWKNFILKEGATLLLMGSGPETSASAIETISQVENGTDNDIHKPLQLNNKPLNDQKVVFEEDMSDQAFAKLYDLPAGIVNLGNTCYMNSVLQCFYAIPILKEKILNYSEPLANSLSFNENKQISFMIAIKQLFTQMSANPTDLIPFIFLPIFHTMFPDFAEKESDSNHSSNMESSSAYRQQDANECLVRIRSIFGDRLKLQNSANRESFMDRYFRGEYEITIKPDDANLKEEPTILHEYFYSLRCFINTDVKYIQTGLHLGMIESIDRFSQILGQNAKYTKTSLISRLPAYLMIQFERFFFKKDSAINAKIRKEVKFPLMFDMLEFCTPALREKLAPQRKAFKDAEDQKAQLLVDTPGARKQDHDKAHDIHHNDISESTIALSSFPDDPGSNNSGYYDLIAVLTHQGRTSNSGHYVAWVKRNDKWMMCDDNNIKPVTEDQILKLCGGGDWHTAYVLIYGPRILKSSSAQVSS